MKQVLHNKKILAIAIVCLVVILSVVITVSIKGKKAETVPESSTSEVVTSSETTTEEVTENVTESTTAEITTETTTKKPVSKPEATTKRPVSKPENTTRAQTTTIDQGVLDTERQVLYWEYGGEEGYKAHLQEIANAKCPGCGNHNCPSMEYEKNRLGDIDSYYWNQQKCPNYGKTKCPHCGKILTDDSSLAKNNTSDKYCLGNCNVTFK